jgi:flavin-dependent dehydrogenase
MTLQFPVRSLADAGRKLWDVIVIGAGPAGALASDLLSREGAAVLLVDAKPFPRTKVCGGCLNALALDLLARCGLESVLPKASAMPLETIRFVTPRQDLACALSRNQVVNRSRFDAALVEASLRSGTEFCPEVHARVLPQSDGRSRRVLLRQDSAAVEVTSRIVLCADGLTQSSLRSLPEFCTEVASGSRIGLGAVLTNEHQEYPGGRLTMALSPKGYVGATRASDHRLTIAAAVDANHLSHGQSGSALIQDILNSCSLPVPSSIDAVRWYGTPPLTRKSARVASRRLIVLGDAAGYVEPFTGEGIGWSLLSAALAAPLTLHSLHEGCDSLMTDWNRLHQQKVIRKQWMCRLLTRILRSSTLTCCTLELCRLLPFLRRSVMSQLSRGPSGPLPPIPAAPLLS